jgi:hypothetical protein
MEIRRFAFELALGVSMTAALGTSAFGAAARTFVASTGSDSNACSRALPCRTFTQALTQTSPGGEIVVLDSAGYGAVPISQSVSIVAPDGVYAGIQVTSGNGVTVSGPGIQVTLRGLTIKGLGGFYGVYFQSGASLRVEHCEISNMLHRSINMEASGQLLVTDSIIRDGGSIGISPPTGGATTLNRVQVIASGLALEGGTIIVRDSVVSRGPIFIESVQPGVPVAVTIERSIVSGNLASGIGVAGTARLILTGSTVTDNGGDGVAAFPGATVIASGNTVAGNGGVGFYAGGTAFESAGNNTLSHNGSPTQGSITRIGQQ